MQSNYRQPHWRGFVSNTGLIAPANVSSKDLPAQSIGFFPISKTGGDPKSVTSINPASHPLFKIGFGKAPFAAQKAKLTFSDKTPFLTTAISKKSILNWKGYKAKKLNGGSTGEVWTVGYDGVNADKTLKAPADFSDAIITVQAWGTPIYKATGTYTQEVSIYLNKGCIDPVYQSLGSIGTPVDYENASANALADDYIKQWKKYKFLGTSLPVDRFVKVSKLRLTNPAQAAKTVACRKYAVVVTCDEGDGTSLGRVQAQYPGYKVVLESHNNATKQTTYTMWRTVAQSTPAALSLSDVVVADCAGACPSGYTSVAAANLFQVRIATGATVAALTGEISRVKVSTAPDVEVYHILAATSTSLATAITNVGATGAPEITLVGVRSQICNLTTSLSFSWSQVDEAFKASKEYKLTLMDKDCKGTYNNRLAEVQAKYPYLTIAEEASTECMTVYSTTVLSECTTEGCGEDAVFTIEAPAPFERGMNWEEFNGTVITTPDCTDPAETTPICEAVGLRFEAASFNRFTDECSYGYFAWDQSDVDPVMIKVTVQKHDHTLSLCDSTFEFPVTKVREIEYEKGTGQMVREIETRWFDYYEYGQAFRVDPIDRALYGLTAIAKPEFYYDEYQLTVKEDASGEYISQYKNESASIMYRMFFREGTGKAFETVINSYIAGLKDTDLTSVVL